MTSDCLGSGSSIPEWRRPSWLAFLCIGFALIYSLYSWLPLLDANWGIIDDHEIIAVVGPRERLPLAEIPAALSKTEVGSAEGSTRFRPGYYSIRLLEAALWGKQPQLWYATRIAIAVLFALMLAAICLRLGGPILTLGFLTFILSQSYWSDIFGRLGPGETYAVLGSCMIVLGFLAAARRGWGVPASTLVAAGVVIAAGSKENFVILALLPLWLVISPSKRVSPGSKAIFGAVLCYIAWISITIISRLKYAGHNVYGESVALASKLALLYSLAIRPDVLAWLGASLCLVASVHVLKGSNEQSRPSRKSLTRYGWATLAMLGVFASQYIFYGDKWPGGGAPRYLFPGMLAKHFAFFLFCVAAGKIAETRFPGLRSRMWFAYLAVALGLSAASVRHLDGNHQQSVETVANTATFIVKLNDILDFLRAHPSAALILNSGSVWDFEPVYSVERYVRAAGLTNPVALMANNYSPASSFESELAQDLERIHRAGGDGFVSLRALDAVVECFSVGLSAPPLVRCNTGNRIWK